MYIELFGQMKKHLAQMDTWLEAATAHAVAKSFEPDVFMTLRLAPDQFAFARQVQVACDTVKLGISRITGKDAPEHADTEATLAELRTRIAAVVKYIDGFTPADFETAASRTITTPRWKGKIMSPHDFLLEHVMPNFFFHATHVYAILRHNGVSVGKRDFLGPLSQRMP